MVVDDADELRVREGDITLTDLAVDRDEKVGTSVVVGSILYGDSQFIDHDNEIALLDGVVASVYELGGLAVCGKESVECEARCECVGIRVVVALDNYVIIF